MPVYRMNVGLKFPGGGRTGVNTWHLRTLTKDNIDLDAAAGIVKKFYTSLQSQFTASYFYSWDGILTEVLNEEPEPVNTRPTWSLQGSAGGADDTGPAGVGLCISWKTNLATRSGRGRTFIAPLHTTKFGPDGTIGDAFLALVRGYAATLVTDSDNLANGAVAIVGLKNKGRPEDGYLARDVIGSSINDKVAYLSTRRS